MNPQLAAALSQAKQTNQPVAVNMGGYTLMAYPNGQVGPQGSGGTARWTPAQPSMPVPPRAPFGTSPSPNATYTDPTTLNTYQYTPPSTTAPPSTTTTTGPATYTDPTTLQSFSSVPSTGAVVASGPGYGTGTVIPQTSQSGPLGSTGPVDRHDAVAAQARVYRINHGLATADDSAATDALNAESLAAERAGRTYLNRDLAAQYGQTPPVGTVGPRTDVVNALQVPTSQGQSIMLAPTTTQQQPINLMQYLPQQQQRYPFSNSSTNFLQQGIY